MTIMFPDNVIQYHENVMNVHQVFIVTRVITRNVYHDMRNVEIICVQLLMKHVHVVNKIIIQIQNECIPCDSYCEIGECNRQIGECSTCSKGMNPNPLDETECIFLIS